MTGVLQDLMNLQDIDGLILGKSVLLALFVDGDL